MLFFRVERGFVENLESDDNGGSGLRIDRSKSVTAVSVEASGNGDHGIWLAESRFSAVFLATTTANAHSGIYVGCSPFGPLGKLFCAGRGRPDGQNKIVLSAAEGNFGAGIAIDFDDGHNTVTSCFAIGNGTNGSKDAVDENDNCDDNSWTSDNFTTTSQSCIH